MNYYLPHLIVLASFMISLGYAIGNTDRFSIWKLIPAGGVYWVMSQGYANIDFNQPIIFIGLVIGYGIANPYHLERFTEWIGIHISNLRYRKAYEDIRRKEEEVEAMRREYESFKREQSNQERDEQARSRKQQSDDFRARQEEQKKQRQNKSQQESSSHRNSGGAGSKSNSSGSSSSYSARGKYLQILGLDANGTYSYKDIKNAYRKQASRYHPDKHQGKGNESEMTKRFQETGEAFEWLCKDLNNF